MPCESRYFVKRPHVDITDRKNNPEHVGVAWCSIGYGEDGEFFRRNAEEVPLKEQNRPVGVFVERSARPVGSSLNKRIIPAQRGEPGCHPPLIPAPPAPLPPHCPDARRTRV